MSPLFALRRSPLLAAAGLALLPSCLSSAPRARFQLGPIEVRAQQVEQAEETGRLAFDQYHWIRATLPDTRDAEAKIWVVPRISPFRGFPLADVNLGLYFDFLWYERIYVREDANPSVTTHELAHLLLADTWQPLPPFLEEGLCDWLSVNCPHAPDPKRHAELRTSAALAIGGELPILIERGDELDAAVLRFGSDLPSLGEVAGHSALRMIFGEDSDRSAAYSLGYVLIDRLIRRVGLEELHAECERTFTEQRRSSTLESWLDLAGLPSEQDQAQRRLGIWLLGDLQQQELRLLLNRMAPYVVSKLFAESAQLPPDSPELRDWVRKGDPRILRAGPAPPVHFVSLPAVQAWLAGDWPDPNAESESDS